MVKDNIISEFMKIFHGLERAYGTYSLKNSTSKSTTGGNKKIGKATTLYQPVTKLIWSDHLSGKEGIGIIPIRDDSTCFFGAIDVDIYDGLKIEEMLKTIEENELPLIPCYTKSGGIHLYTFVNEPVPARLIREKLTVFAAVLGFSGSEIYPRQDTVLSEKGDIGQWINVPYFNYKDTTRFAIDLTGKKLTVEKFFNAVDAVKKSAKEFEAFTVELLPDISDGPPCLQFLLTKGFSSGTRNDGMFNLGIYLKRMNSDSWKTLIDEFNMKFFDPPLSSQEISGVVKSLDKKDYEYNCSKIPLKPHCNSSLCRLRKFGVGPILDMPVLTALTKYDTKPPIWFVDIEGGGRLELETADLQNQQRFQRVCLEALNVMTPIVKPGVWQGIVRTLLDNVSVIEASEDASPKGQLLELLESFCSSNAQARTVDEILLGKPFTEDKFTYFKLCDFLAFLDRKKFREFSTNKITSIIKDIGGEPVPLRVAGKRNNIWKVPEFSKPNKEIEPEIETPEEFF